MAPPGFFKHVQFGFNCAGLLGRGQAGPKWIEGGQILICGLGVIGEIVVEKLSFVRIPEIFVDGITTGGCLILPRKGVTFMAQYVAHFREVEFHLI